MARLSLGPGSAFGRYELIRRLDGGGMGEVFLSRARGPERVQKLVVLKRLRRDRAGDESSRARFVDEARIAVSLAHPHVVPVFEFGELDGEYFMVMEFLRGGDLARVAGVDRPPLGWAATALLGSQLCDALAYVHGRTDRRGAHLVHGDLTPRNVLLSTDGHALLADFGLARYAAQGRAGTARYLAPEQARGESIDWRSDIFAAGVMLFELTTGKRLFKGASEYETLKLICERDYPFPSMVRAGYPPELELIVMKALAKDREARYQSAREMQLALEEFARSTRVATSTIALSSFMQTLFEEKLQSQKEALLQGKQLADIIALQHDADSGEFDGGRPSQTLSTPAAAHTVTNAGSLRPSSNLGLAAGLLMAFAVLAGAGGGVFWLVKHGRDARDGKPVDAVTASPGQERPERKGSIAVASDPPGASIWINGDLRPESTPAVITQLPIGSPIDVKLTKDGFEQSKETVTLTTAAPDGKVSPAMRPGSVSVSVAAKPAGALVTMLVDGKAASGLDADGLTSGVSHRVVVSAPGYADHALTFMGEPMEKKHFDVVLERVRRSSRAPGGGSSANGVNGAVPMPAMPVSPAPPAVGTGKLNVGATGGWCNVSVDGAPRGATPVAGIELPAGPHRVTCVMSDGGSQSATITVTAAETARFKFAL